MKENSKWRYMFGAAVVLAVAALIFVVFSLLSVTEKTDLALGDTQERRFGWRCEVLMDDGARPYEPVFENWYYLQLPEDTRAVRITRVMTENIPQAELQWMSYQDGVEVALDGVLLYTDFPGLERDGDGFVHPDGEQWARVWREQGETVRSTRMTLPANYVGRELSVTTYYREGHVQMPEYPYLGGADATIAASTLVTSVRYNAVMTLYALLTLLMAGVFLVDEYNNSRGDGRTLLLCLYFLLLFLKEAYGSITGYYSVLTARLDLGGVVLSLLLVLYAALKSYPMDYDEAGKLIVDPAKMAADSYKNAGMALGFFLGWFLDRRVIKMSDCANGVTRVVRTVLGFAAYGLVEDYAAPWVGSVVGGNMGKFAQQFVLVFFILALMPLVFKLTDRLTVKKEKKA